jgi:hypothetical protein
MAGLLGFLGAISPNEDGTPNALQRFDNALNPGQQLQQLQTQAAMAKLQQEQATQTALANWAQKGGGDVKSLYRDMAAVNPSYLEKFLEASSVEPKTTGLPEGQMWGKDAQGNFVAVPIPGAKIADKPYSEIAKLKADLDAGRIDKETYDRKIAKETAPTEKNYKQFQLQNAAFADMMVKANETLSPYEAKISKGEFDPVNNAASFLSGIPSLGLGAAAGNAMLSDDQQKYKQAQEAWVRAKLRKESGAAIGVKEMEDEIKTFFPRVGDSLEVIKQKSDMRNEATASMQKQTGGAYDDMYGVGTEQPTAPAPTKPKYSEGQRAKWPDGSIKTFMNGRWQ